MAKGVRSVNIPLTVYPEVRDIFVRNIEAVTGGSGRLFMFAADQKIEHLHDDFTHEGALSEIADPEHLFKIAACADVGLFATHFGLIASYARDYPSIRYCVKLNGKSNLISKDVDDPRSALLTTVEEVVRFRDRTHLSMCAVGLTVYLGSRYEHEMLACAARVVEQAHACGLLAIVWMYPRGIAVHDERDGHLIAGAAGVAASLGADFVKINPPLLQGIVQPELLRSVVHAAGRTGVICSGGARQHREDLMRDVRAYLEIGGVAGVAVGRNIFQHAGDDAVSIAQEIKSMVVGT